MYNNMTNMCQSRITAFVNPTFGIPITDKLITLDWSIQTPTLNGTYSFSSGAY